MANGPKQPRVRLFTPTFRASFTDVFQKRVFEGQSEESGRYSCAALFSGFEVKDGITLMRAPAAWSEKDKEKWNAIIKACNDVALSVFKKPLIDLRKIGGYKLPFHRGEEKEYEGYGAGTVYFTMSAKNRRPGIVARDGVTPITENSVDEFYPGCYARASVTPFANLQWKSISIGLNNLQKLADGPRLDAFTSAEDDFGSDPADFAGDEDAGVEEAQDDFA